MHHGAIGKTHLEMYDLFAIVIKGRLPSDTLNRHETGESTAMGSLVRGVEERTPS